MLKTFILLSLCFCLQSFGKSYSQDRLTVKQEKASLKKILTDIQENSKYRFLYDDDILKEKKNININVKEVYVTDILEKLLAGTSLTYKMINNNLIAIHNLEIAYADISITGAVFDEEGKPIPGATVKIKETNKAITTNKDGKFTIIAPENSILTISYLGYEPQEVKVNSNNNNLNIRLKGAVNSLKEMVVIGYGVQKKVNLTGAISSVKIDEIIGDRPVTSTAQLLQGSVPGFQIVTSNGQPGAGSDLNIRGTTSINGGSPLVLVDNVPMDMNDINPRDIASISILKDASASAIYGARAAFGVVLITTKTGSRNQPLKFEYSTNLSTTAATTLPVKASPLEYVTAMKDFGNTSSWTGQNIDTWLGLLNEYNANPSTYPDGSSVVGGIKYFLKENNHYADFFENSFEQLHNLSVSGGSDKTSFRVSLGYNNEDGIIVSKADNYSKINFNSSINTAISSKVNFIANILYKNDVRYVPWNYGALFNRLIQPGSFAPSGEGTTLDGLVLPYATAANQVRNEPASKNFGDNLRMFGKLEYTPVKGLKINGEYTFNRTTANTQAALLKNRYINISTSNPEFSNSVSQYSRADSLSNYHAVNIYANYTAAINDTHHISALIGTNQESSQAQMFNINRLDLITSTVPSISTSSGTVSGNDSFSDFKISGYFGRINYDYKNRYLLEGSARYDGSSRFPKGSRFGFFPSFSAGWVASEEPFMKSISAIIPLLKLRASYGEIGNQAIGNYAYIPSIDVNSNSPWINPATSLRYTNLVPPGLVSSNFTWERVQSLNFGIDLGLFENKLTASLEIFRRRTLDMLAAGSELPAILGAAAPLQNVADLKSTGWDLQVGWADRINNFKYNVNFVLSDNQAYITRFNNIGGVLNISGGVPGQYFVGRRLGDIWGYTTQGYFTAADFVDGSLNTNLMNGTLKPGIAPFQGVLQNPGDIRYVDSNGDGKISNGTNTIADHGDLSIIGNSNRRYQFGINGSMSYKDVDLSFFASGVGKRDLWINNQVYFPYIDQFANLFKNNLDYWTATNTNGYFPRSYASATGNTGTSRQVQTKYLANGAYFRMKNITLGYALPKNIASKISASKARIFVSGENLFTLDKLPDGLDPDATNLGTGGIYPLIRKYSFGINLTF
ncbi:TonB-dependent receptor [Pedobacter borealis]|uniref:TonB-dependent receptor n=1 Tax=Pedobacter borealis TaxID=475254 RepID=UPI0004930BDA|nr:TonB-dependent receptor [Pedobacter borealis]